MPVSLEEVYQQESRLRLEFLQYCIFTKRLEGIFLHAAAQFRSHYTIDKALALYDCFCAEKAPARLGYPQFLPPMNQSISWTVQRIRQSMKLASEFVPSEEEPDPPVIVQPHRYLFEPLEKAMWLDPNSSARQAASEFNPELTALENLPDGRLTMDQRRFVSEVWFQLLRPALSSAGYRHLITLGQL